jgi:hypothetical protein
MRDRRDRVNLECDRQLNLQLREAFMERELCRLATLASSRFDEPTEEEQEAKMLRKVAQTLARDWHAEHAPAWACPLPVEMSDCEWWTYNDCNAFKLLGYFGRSMLWNDLKKYEQHPHFDRFCRGAMASSITPRIIRLDPELQDMFPPQPLAGLALPLHWRNPTA